MIALTHENLFTIQIALEAMITDISRKQKAALKRRDVARLKDLALLGDAALAAKRKIILMKGGAS